MKFKINFQNVHTYMYIPFKWFGINFDLCTIVSVKSCTDIFFIILQWQKSFYQISLGILDILKYFITWVDHSLIKTKQNLKTRPWTSSLPFSVLSVFYVIILQLLRNTELNALNAIGIFNFDLRGPWHISRSFERGRALQRI